MDIINFIKKHNIGTSIKDFKDQVALFVSEMEIGLGCSPRSLKMIPAYISFDNATNTAGKKVIVIDAGGTNLRIALVMYNDDGIPEIKELYNHTMLGVGKEVTAAELFDGLASYLKPVIGKSSQIGFCFSYPCEIQPNMDAKILEMTKEVKVKDCVGVLLGEGLRKALKEQGREHDHSIVVLNDTVAALLAGKACAGNRVYDSYIGYILGTGSNAAYIEQNRKIVKNEVLADKEGYSIINIESGGYCNVPMNDIDKMFDSGLEIPKAQMLEKMVSGGYQGIFLTEYIKQAAREGYFPENLTNISSLQTKDIGEFIDYPFGDNKLAALLTNADDKTNLFRLINAYFERAASLVVMNLAGAMVKAGIGKDPLMPVCITAEGSTFYKLKLFNKKINYYMLRYVGEELGMYSEFVQVENAILNGTAFAAVLAD